MSAREFKVGQTVSGDDFAYLPRGTVVAGPGVPTRRKDALGMWVTRDSGHPAAVPDKGMAMSRTITYLPDSAEPEDKDDLYVEPEPLKEGDWCLVWAQFDTVEPDDDGDVTVDVPGSGLGTQYVRADAIVRPDAGQVPPWITAEQDEAKAISAIKTALVVDGGMHDDRYTQQTAESLYRAGIRATKGGAS